MQNSGAARVRRRKKKKKKKKKKKRSGSLPHGEALSFTMLMAHGGIVVAAVDGSRWRWKKIHSCCYFFFLCRCTGFSFFSS